MLALDLVGPTNEMLKLILSATALAGLGKSVYNGYIRRAMRAFGEVDHLTDRMNTIAAHQRLLVDATVALAYANQDGLDVDASRLHAELVDEDGPGRFLTETPDDPDLLTDGGEDE